MASPLSPLENATLNSISCEPAAKRVKTTRYQQDQQLQDQEQRSPLVSFSPGSYEVEHASSITTITTTSAASAVSLLATIMDSATESLPATTSPTQSHSDTHMSDHINDHHNHSSQENVAPHAFQSKPIHSPAMSSSSTTTTSAPPPAFSSRQARPGSRILSGSELSPLKILQGRVAGGPTSSAASSVTLGSPASPDSGAESRRDTADDAASSTASSPPPTFPPTRRMSTSSNQMLPPALPLGRTPRKATGSEKRFPVKISVPIVASPTASPVISATPVSAAPRSPSQPPVQRSVPPSPSQAGQVLFTHIQQQQQPLHGRQMSLDEAIQLNEGLQQAIEIFEDETSAIENEPSSKPGRHSDGGIGTPNGYHHSPHQHPYQSRRRDSVTSNSARGFSSPLNEPGNVDDTMLSTFSTFSAVPNTLSRVGASTHGANSPNKAPASGIRSRRGSAAGIDSVSGRPPRISTTGRPGHSREHSNTTTNLLMDFTEQLRQQNSSYRGDPTAATPQRKNLVNLLDFEIPPLPTPRSIPTVTPRELESLKSNFLSEISSLKATLSGKEAEVTALKTAVGDAEKRVGECMEQIREERGARDLVAEEKEQWERRGREMEDVLRKVKGEIVLGHRDRDELEAKLDESEKRREAAEMMAQEAETKMAAMRAGRATAEAESNRTRSPGGSTSSSAGSSAVQREVEIAVERVARELHMAYKAKHETKVAALKKSYEARWEKRVRELETVAEALASENEKLRMSRDAALTRMAPSQEEHRAEEERRRREANDATRIKSLGAEVENLEAVLRTVKADNSELRTLLEQERVEKGELVIMAEELMAMQQQQQSFMAANAAPAPAPAPTPAVKRASISSTTSNGPSMSPRKTVPKTPRPGSRTSIGGPPGSAVPASSNRNSMMVNGTSNSAASTATTPGRARPMSMHGTGRLSGLKPPSSSTMSTGGVPSRIGRIGHDRKMSNSNGSNGSNSSAGSAPRPPSGLGTRSGLMSSIEKMGRGRE